MNKYMKMADRMYNLDKQIEQLKKKNEELERKLEQTEKDLADYQFNYPTIKELEHEKRLLGERCTQLLKDKGDLTDQIADIKANCDLAIEGRDVKIMELEKENELFKKANEIIAQQRDGRDVDISILENRIEELELELTVEKDQHQEETILHLHAEEYIKSLEQQIEKMKCCANCKSFKGYGETCEGWGEPVLNLNCDCTEWELREKVEND